MEETAEGPESPAADTAEGKITPVMRDYDCRMMTMYHTPKEPMRSFVDKLMSTEAHSELSSMSNLTEHTPGPDPDILSISCIHGFMPADVEAMGSHILVVTNDAPAKGAALAESLGNPPAPLFPLPPHAYDFITHFSTVINFQRLSNFSCCLCAGNV